MRQRFGRHRLAVLGLAILALLVIFSFIGPAVSPYEPDQQFIDIPNGSFTSTNLLGTDELGRDVMTRLMWAGRISLTVSIIVTIISTILGVTVGAMSGYFGGWVDTLTMRFVDFMLTLPQLPILLILSAMSLRGGLPITPPAILNRFFGAIWGMPPDRAENLLILAAVLIAFGWLGIARLIRGQILSLRETEFSTASRALGASSTRIIFNHMIPNALAPIIVAMTFGFGDVIITEAALSFVGFGVQPPSPSWGNMLNGVRDFMLIQPWRAFVPGLAIFLASISFNFIGDALRDALDPRLKL
jgi:peptide/nickel transport system permease protein